MKCWIHHSDLAKKKLWPWLWEHQALLYVIGQTATEHKASFSSFRATGFLFMFVMSTHSFPRIEKRSQPLRKELSSSLYMKLRGFQNHVTINAMLWHLSVQKAENNYVSDTSSSCKSSSKWRTSFKAAATTFFLLQMKSCSWAHRSNPRRTSRSSWLQQGSGIIHHICSLSQHLNCFTS